MKKLHLITLLTTASLAFAFNSFAVNYHGSVQVESASDNKNLESSAVYAIKS